MNGDRLIKAAHYVTDPFGYRINPITKKSEGHNGTDYGTNRKKVPCYAVDDGKVLKVSKDRFGANFVYVQFTRQGKVGLYYHLDSVSVKVGQAVNSGTQIGIVGTTGQSTGVHLHFSWIEDNANAMKYYSANYSDFEKYVFKESEEDEMKIFKTINEVPAWAQPTIKKGVDKGYISTNEKNEFAVPESNLQTATWFYELGLWDHAKPKNDQPPELLAEEWHAAIKAGITDGSKPNAYSTREQVATMIMRSKG